MKLIRSIFLDVAFVYCTLIACIMMNSSDIVRTGTVIRVSLFPYVTGIQTKKRGAIRNQATNIHTQGFLNGIDGRGDGWWLLSTSNEKKKAKQQQKQTKIKNKNK